MIYSPIHFVRIKGLFKNMGRLFLFFFTTFFAVSVHADSVRVKDIGKLQGWRDNALFGTGIVTGLAGTGDSANNRATRQALSNAMAQFNLTISADQIQSRNVALVMVSASLPTFAREGDLLDITVTSTGDSRSLLGGNLLLTPLRASNGRVYALAQGSLQVGGYRYDTNGNVVQKNHPTVGSIPSGGTVEVGVSSQMLSNNNSVTFVLNQADYTTANRVASAINTQVAPGIARAIDAAGIDIFVPEIDRDRLVGFLARLESVTVEPDRRARVVVNERTGTVVSGGDVRISKVSISHGDLKISISEINTASQPELVVRPGSGVRTAIVTNAQISVNERPGGNFLTASSTVSDLVQSLAVLKTPTRDIISILRAVKAAGALHAELVVQ